VPAPRSARQRLVNRVAFVPAARAAVEPPAVNIWQGRHHSAARGGGRYPPAPGSTGNAGTSPSLTRPPPPISHTRRGCVVGCATPLEFPNPSTRAPRPLEHRGPLNRLGIAPSCSLFPQPRTLRAAAGSSERPAPLPPLFCPTVDTFTDASPDAAPAPGTNAQWPDRGSSTGWVSWPTPPPPPPPPRVSGMSTTVGLRTGGCGADVGRRSTEQIDEL